MSAFIHDFIRHDLIREHREEEFTARFEKLDLASPIPYNANMFEYGGTGQHEKAHSVLAEMKQNGVLPNNFTYKMCIYSYGRMSDISSMDKLLEEMEQQPHIVMDWRTYFTVANIYLRFGFPDKATLLLKKAEGKLVSSHALAWNEMISFYGRLGDKSALWRLWELRKKECTKPFDQDYAHMLAALIKIGELQEAETLLEEWESGKFLLDFGVPNVLLDGYITNGLIEKAEALLDAYVKKGRKPPPESWDIVAKGYAEKGEMGKAHEMMKNALEASSPDAEWTPSRETIVSILCYLGANVNLEDVETFLGLYKVAWRRDRYEYDIVIRRAGFIVGNGVDDLLEGTQDDGIKEKKDNKGILALDERKSS